MSEPMPVSRCLFGSGSSDKTIQCEKPARWRYKKAALNVEPHLPRGPLWCDEHNIKGDCEPVLRRKEPA